MSGFGRAVRDRPLLSFFLLAYAVSWAFWCPAVLASFGWIDPVPARYLHLAGGLGPMVAAIAVTSLAGGQPALGLVSLVLGSILLTWLFNSSGGSIGAVVVANLT